MRLPRLREAEIESEARAYHAALNAYEPGEVGMLTFAEFIAARYADVPQAPRIDREEPYAYPWFSPTPNVFWSERRY